VYCQLVHLRDCLPGRLWRALDELPNTLDETYQRTLREVNKENWEFARTLFQCIAAASRPLRVEELAGLLAFGFQAGQIPKFHEDWHLVDSVLDAVLSTCSKLLSFVGNIHGSGILLHLDENVTSDSLREFPLVEYAAQNLVDHVRIEGVWQNVEDGMKHLFDPNKPHLTTWVWIYDPAAPSLWYWYEIAGRPSAPREPPCIMPLSLAYMPLLSFWSSNTPFSSMARI
jgi:hypothetical protein